MSAISINYDELLKLAIAIARKAHEGQIDKAGRPYIEHPITVMDRVDTVEEKIVAVLHDTVEDSELTVEHLKLRGFPDPIADAIAAITKLEDEPYEEYLGRVTSNPLALKVKIADVSHNLDISRIANPTDKDLQRLNKYKVVLKRLQAAMAWHLGRNQE